MKKLIARFKCWWNGHFAPPYGEDGEECLVCERTDLTSEDWYAGGAKYRIWSWWTFGPPDRLRTWLSKCPDCGKRFGRHTQECDDIPF